jgi:hypothetical protein
MKIKNQKSNYSFDFVYYLRFLLRTGERLKVVVPSPNCPPPFITHAFALPSLNNTTAN